MTARRRKSLLIALFALLTLGFTAPTQQEDQKASVIAIVDATVVDGTGAAPVQATVLIRGDRIAAVGKDVQVPVNARVIHAPGQTLLPGLFDLHTHLEYSTTRVIGDWPKHLEAYVYCGVTSVADFGTYPETFEPMRRLIRNGIDSPRIAFAARISTPGGHGAEGGRGDFFTLEVQTPREARAAIQHVLPYHPDVIKAFTDGWRYDTAPDLTSMNEATLTALVDEAHKHGLKVLTHTVTLERDKIAARAGVDVIDHGIGNAEVDDELIRLLKAKGTTYASTLAVYEPRENRQLSPLATAVLEPAVRETLEPEGAPTRRPAASAASGAVSAFVVARERRWKNLQHNVAALQAAGIPIGDGTDAGETGTFHGWATLHEMELLVASGLTPMQAITAATYNSAKALGVEAERGTIAPGKLADLVLVEGEPFRNIADIEHTTHVFLAGREIDRERLLRDINSPELTPIPSVKAAELLDDFEGSEPDGIYLHSRIGTLWVDSMDAGTDHSRMAFGRTLRAPGDHALAVMGWMSEAEHPWVSVNLPLSPGAVEPVDARGFRGVRFDVRGDGDYRLVVPTRAVRDGNFYQEAFQAKPVWQTVSIELSSLAQPRALQSTPWTGTDLLALMFRIERARGQVGW